jgi:hypothetical protein
MTTRFCHQWLAVGVVVAIAAGPAANAWCQETGSGQGEPTQLDKAIQSGLRYLREHGQAEDGTFSVKAGPGLTALAVTAMLRNGLPLDDPMVAKGLAALEKNVKPDGGIYGNGRLKNYETCVAIVCFELANKDGRYNDLLRNAERFLRGLQYVATDSDDHQQWDGGVGYGGPERPDLSNTSYLIEALVSRDDDANKEAIQRALAFVSCCQNLDSPYSKYNDTRFAALVNDGGFYYTFAVENVDPSTSGRYTENGGLRSYGSMTYAGFKSMVYAGLTKDDPRVKAALEWISRNYTVERNPGVGDAGLYYYYHTFATALRASGLDAIVDDHGASHDWRGELAAELARRQGPDGSWTNANRQWFENDPNLATSFALIALSYCKPKIDQPE